MLHNVEVDETARRANVGVYLMDVHIRASDLRATTAVNSAPQLAFDAACIAVLYSDIDVEEVDDRLSNSPDLVLTLMWARSGSMREVFILDPLTKAGRRSIRMIFGAACIALTAIPGAAAVAAVLTIAMEGILTIGELKEERHNLVPNSTIDERALDLAFTEATTTIQVFEPGQIWVPPHADAAGDESQQLQAAYIRIEQLQLENARLHEQVERIRGSLEE